MATATKNKKRMTATVLPKAIKVKRIPFLSGGKRYYGRLSNGQISLNLKENQECIKLLEEGFSHKAIAKALNFTVSQVQNRARMAKISVRDYRSGKSKKAKIVIRKHTVQYY